ncbi:carboxylating nicotinate-nucleotide diphosphorylase [Leptospirillum ferriphilum]|uniref:nicotinate-nucleotide diphosphorylase (carboxylating) n=2 Tax=Leptospirillum TaxID=179 RepID=A0A094X323_9BACT|nr:carboxylating nicotinate-nucleotide diphosphorylase [Leptospirillum ferriphilum]EDZ38790.1 MAG: Nicotinate-nucleotide pyrophosphorylase [Leptospirillum sp. Group II '5-way CG']KGA92959.1 Quinolinate phosphoribosyltransferase (decarboxylating) [Leptospirillum ferriphilum]
MTELFDPFVREAISVFLAEDVGRGDVTTRSLFSWEERSRNQAAHLVAESPGRICGIPFVEEVFLHLDPGTSFQWNQREGEPYLQNAVLGRIECRLEALLAGERLALNLLKHLSGIAFLSSVYVERAAKARPAGMRPLRVVETRKTLPGLRFFQKYAVRTGGGHNHRYSLDDGLLIKDNHLVAAGGVKPALEKARKNAPHPLRIELEVDTAHQALEGAQEGADILLLDNMATTLLEQLVPRLRLLNPSLILEVSGGVTLERIEELARLDIDVISVGALTHSSPDAPIRLDFLA